MKFIIYNILLTLLFFSFNLSNGQNKRKKKKRIELVRANELQGGKFEEKKINKFIGNVVFSHRGAKFYCDSAYRYTEKEDQDKIEAFGNVRIQQGDSITLTGDRLTYNGDTRKAMMTGNVILKKGRRVLQHNSLNYKIK